MLNEVHVLSSVVERGKSVLLGMILYVVCGYLWEGQQVQNNFCWACDVVAY